MPIRLMPIRILPPRVVIAYGGWMLALAAAFFAFPPVRDAIVAAIGISTAAAIIHGVRRHRPARAGTWLVLAAALLLNVAARLMYGVLPGPPGFARPHIWVIYAMHLAMSVLMIVGLVGLARHSGRRRSDLIDTAILILGAGLLAGVLIAAPYAITPGLHPVQASLRIGYVVRDVLVLAAAAHFATAVRWTWPVVLVLTGALGFVAHDAVFRLGRIRGEWLAGGPSELGWLWLFIAWGMAALLPAMAALGVPARTRPRESASLRLGLVAVSSLLPFAMLLIGSTSRAWHRPLVAAVSTLILVLVLVRMAGVAVRLHRQVTGERVLRHAIAELAAARRVPSVTAALDTAVRHLLPHRSRYGVLLTTDGDGGGSTGLRESATLPRHITERLGETDTTLVFALGGPHGGDGHGGHLQHADPERADPEPAAAAHAGGGTLFVAADRAALATLRPRLEVLATQAALALERMRLNEEIIRHTNEAYFRALVQNAADIILIIDDDNRIRYASPTASSLFGPAELAGTWLPGLVDGGDRHSARQLLDRARAVSAGDALTTGEPTARSGWINFTDWNVRGEDGSPARVEVSCRDLRHDASIRGLVVTLRDVTEKRRLERELTERAYHDSLTGLPNRLLFGERVQAAVEASVHNGSLTGVLFVDLDDFKVINDGLGHEIGDAVLRAVGGRLTDIVPADMMTARFGGDAFAVLVPHAADARTVEEVAERIVTDLRRPIQVEERHVVTVGASIGVATTADARTAPELVRCADLSLYAAKDMGKGQWRRYEPSMRSAIMDRLELRSSLERAIHDGALSAGALSDGTLSNGAISGGAISNGALSGGALSNGALSGGALSGGALREWTSPGPTRHNGALIEDARPGGPSTDGPLTLEYQPIVSLATGRTAGLEALLRWEHPTRGRLTPDMFIDVAEDSGLIAPIGDWVLTTAMREARRWEDAAPDHPPYVAVNVSARQFRTAGFVERIRHRLAATGLAPDRLHLEITESLLLRDDDRVWEDLARLRGLGVRIAIDDFGTGYSSLSYLRQVPLDVVKLDRIFVSTMSVSAQQRDLVEGIVGLTQILELEVVAEGIETEAERDLAERVGCTFGQGYLFARPLPPDDASRWVAARSGRSRHEAAPVPAMGPVGDRAS